MLVGLAAAFATSSPAAAAGPAVDGWWTASPVPLTPDPEAGLLVQGSPDAEQPLAYAAVAFTLDDGETASLLTLTVPADAVATPGASLTVCPLVEPFQPEHGAPSDRAPGYDCTTSVTAVPDGTTYVVDVAGLGGSGELAVALLPSTSVDRIVLGRPSDDALTTEAASSGSTSSSSSASSPSSSSSSASSSAGTASAGSSTSGAAPRPSSSATPRTPAVPAPAAAVPAAAPASSAQAQAPVAAPASAPVSSVDGGGGTNGRVILVLALVAIAGALWLASGHSSEVPDGVAEAAV